MTKKEYDRKRYQEQRIKLLAQHRKWRKDNPNYYRNRKERTNQLQNQRNKTIIGYLRIVYANMNQRCNNKNIPCYKDYGGRGIRCLFKSVNKFIDYVVNELKIDPRGLQIDRIDNNGNYEKSNIRFVTAKENMDNRKR